MKKLFLICNFLLLAIVAGNSAIAQCYKCGADVTSWTALKKGPTKALKNMALSAEQVKWYSCEFGFKFGVKDYGDSTKTYIFSEDNKWLGTETRYMIQVERHFDVGAEPDPTLASITRCVSPNILPKNLWPLVAPVFNLSDLDTLNKVDGAPFWVCDLFKVELPRTHPIAKHESTNIFYVANMDFIFHVYTRNREVVFKDNDMTNHGFLYMETETIYESSDPYEHTVPPTPPAENHNNGRN